MTLFVGFLFALLFFSYDYFVSILLTSLVIYGLIIYGSDLFAGNFFFDSLSCVLVFLSFLLFFYCMYSSFLDFWSSNFFGPFVGVLGGMYLLLFFSFSCFSFLFFYMSFEFLFLLMYFFLLNWGYSPERLQASFYMIFYTVVVSFPFLIWVVLSETFFGEVFGANVSFGMYWWAFFVLVFLVKLPVYGAHLWLPKAHVEAPVSGSMILAGILLKLGGYGLIRFSCGLLGFVSVSSGYLMSLGLLGGLASCYLCLRQSDMKAFVAYSSVCHMGFALGGLYSGNSLGLWGGLLMLIAHGYCSSCLFYLLYVFYERCHSRSLLILKGLGGALPMLGMVWFVFSIINMGFPPFFSFFSEIMLVSSLSGNSLTSFFFSGLLLFFAGCYCVFMFVICFHGKGNLEGFSGGTSLREYHVFYFHLFYLSFFFFLFFYFF